MTVEILFNPKDLDDLATALLGLPNEIKSKAVSRAMRKMRDMAKTRYVNEAGRHTNMPKSVIRKMTSASINGGGNGTRLIVSSGWIAIYDLPHTRTSEGIMVKGRGLYRHAFVATMKNKGGDTDSDKNHTGIFRRKWPEKAQIKNPKRAQVTEQFAANPPNAVHNDPDRYLEILAELIQEKLAPRLLHEVDFLLPR